MRDKLKLWDKSGLLDVLLVSLLFLAGVFMQTYSIGTLVLKGSDEGIYLYASKLVAQGYSIYSDFFLVHLPFWIYVNTWILKVLNWNWDYFHYIYSVWVVSAIIPMYLLAKQKWGTLSSALACIVFLSFPEFMQWDSHLFSMRQASLPLLAWSLYNLANKRYLLTTLLLTIYSMGLITNTLIATVIIAIWLLGRSRPELNRIVRQLCVPYVLGTSLYYALVFRMPGAWSSIIDYQLQNNFVPYRQRLEYILGTFFDPNGFHMLLAMAGIGIALFRTEWLGMTALVSGVVVVLMSRTFYPHYMSSVAVLLSLMGGSVVSYANNIRLRVLAFIIIFGAIMVIPGPTLYNNLILSKSPDFYRIVDSLKEQRGPVFTFSPIFALYAHLDIVNHYRMADSRSLMVLGLQYNLDEYQDLLRKSNTVLIDDDTRYAFSDPLYSFLRSNFALKEIIEDVEIWVKESPTISSGEKY